MSEWCAMWGKLRLFVTLAGLLLMTFSVLPAEAKEHIPVPIQSAAPQSIQRFLAFQDSRIANKTARFRADHILVRFKDQASVNAIASVHTSLGAASVKRFSIVKNLHLVRLPQGLSVESALASYRKDPNVLHAEPDYEVKALTTPNDPSFSALWGLLNTGQNGGVAGADIKAADMWDIITGSKDVVIAVIDTGVDYTHQDIAGNMWRNVAECTPDGIDNDGNGYTDDCHGINTIDRTRTPMDDNNHGTHVSGIIGAVGNNSLGVVGVNWNVSIMACKFLDGDGGGYNSNAIECLDYVADMKKRGVNIVATSNSWGGGDFSVFLWEAIDAHRKEGILFIAAAANSAGDNDVWSVFPASYGLPNVISVAATDNTDNLAFFSNDGRRTVHLGAPGLRILSTTIGDTYQTFSGTSMATPYVTGVAALLKAQDPSRDWRAIKNLILAGGDTLPSLTNTITRKRLNAYGALTCADSVVLARLFPAGRAIQGQVGVAIDLSVLHINCASPNGEVTVTVGPGGSLVTLKDDGNGIDQAAGDGIYSGQWTPTAAGAFTLTFPGGDVLAVHVIAGQEPVFFSPQIWVPKSNRSLAVAIGDLNGDGRNDVVASPLCYDSTVDYNIGLMFQDASGTLNPPVNYSLGVGWFYVTSLAIGDVNGDGRADLVIANFDSPQSEKNFIGVLLQNADGALGPLTTYPTQNSFVVRVADLNNDGLLDIASAGPETDTVDVYFQNGDGTLAPPVVLPVQHGINLEIGDVNNDGLNDIVVGNSPMGGYVHPESPSVGVLHQKPGGTFGPPSYLNLRCADREIGCPIGSLAIGDVNSDGLKDIVVTDYYEWTIGVFTQAPGGEMNPPVTYSAFWNPIQVRIADVNGDGQNDVIAAQQAGWYDYMSVYLQAPNFSLFPYLNYGGSVQGFYSDTIAVGDVNGDGLPDIVAADPNFGVGVFHGTPQNQAPARQFIMQISKQGKGKGTVTSSPEGINCGDTCQAYFNVGTRVRLTAAPEPGSLFFDWGYKSFCEFDAKGNCTVVIFENRTVTPVFVPESVRVTVTKAGTGTGMVTSDFPGISCGSVCAADYPVSKTYVVLKAVPDDSSTFTRWDSISPFPPNIVCRSGATCSVPLDQSSIVQAVFTAKALPLTVTRSGDGDGTVTSTPAGIDCGATCSAGFPTGSSVTLTAEPQGSSTFTGWSGDCSGKGTCTVTMYAAKSVKATFANPCGYTVSPKARTVVHQGGSLKLNITGLPGSRSPIECNAPHISTDREWIIASSISFDNNKGAGDGKRSQERQCVRKKRNHQHRTAFVHCNPERKTLLGDLQRLFGLYFRERGYGFLWRVRRSC